MFYDKQVWVWRNPEAEALEARQATATRLQDEDTCVQAHINELSVEGSKAEAQAEANKTLGIAKVPQYPQGSKDEARDCAMKMHKAFLKAHSMPEDTPMDENGWECMQDAFMKAAEAIW